MAQTPTNYVRGGHTMIFKDIPLQCHDCKKDFVFTVAEQEQFASMGYTNSPRRCNSCREQRKARQANNPTSGYRNGSYEAKPRRQMYAAVCSECKKETQVPFKPSQDKPVYCGLCYNKIRAAR